MKMDLIRDLRNANKLGIALGGGGARGLAHLGVLKVLEANGIEGDVFSGTSFGAIIAAFYCNGYNWRELLEIIRVTKWYKMLDISMKGGLMKGDALGSFFTKYLPEDFSGLKKPLTVIATDLNTGKRVSISDGDLIKALRASACFPGIFEPVQYGSYKLIDGQILDSVPVSGLVSHGVDKIIAVSVNSPLDYSIYDEDITRWWVKLRKKAGLEKPSLPLEVMIKSIEIMIEKITHVNLALYNPDLYIHIDLSGFQIYSFDKYKEIIACGEKSAKRALKA
jgi:NTE family protein